MEQSKFAYSPLEKAFEKQRKKEVGALKSLNLSSKRDELRCNHEHNVPSWLSPQ